MNYIEKLLNDEVMKANELMIDDWVCNHESNQYQRVWLLDYDNVILDGYYSYDYDDIEPIPLTPEILEKNGWTYNDEDEKFSPQTWVGGGLMLQGAGDCGYRIVVTSDYDDEDTNNTPFVICYVHELQHALKLRRIKKEIVL